MNISEQEKARLLKGIEKYRPELLDVFFELAIVTGEIKTINGMSVANLYPWIDHREVMFVNKRHHIVMICKMENGDWIILMQDLTDEMYFYWRGKTPVEVTHMKKLIRMCTL